MNTFKTILLIIFMVFFAALVLQNTEVIEFQFLVFDTQMSMALLLIMFLVTGLAVGYFYGRTHQRRRTRRRQERQELKEQRNHQRSEIASSP